MCCANPAAGSNKLLSAAVLVGTPKKTTRSDAKFKSSDFSSGCMSILLLLALACLLSNYSVSLQIRSFLYEAFLIEDLGAILLLWALWKSILRRSGKSTRLTVSNESMYSRYTHGIDTDAMSVSCTLSGSIANPVGVTHCANQYRSKRSLRRRLHYNALEELQRVLVTLCGKDPACQRFAQGTDRPRIVSRGVANFHKSLGSAKLLPVDVAAYQYAPEVSEHLQRLLEDQWTIAEGGFGKECLTSILE